MALLEKSVNTRYSAAHACRALSTRAHPPTRETRPQHHPLRRRGFGFQLELLRHWCIWCAEHTPGYFGFGELEASLAKAPLGVSLSPSQAGAAERLDTVSPCGSVFQRLIFMSSSHLGEGNGNPLRCSCRENPLDRGAGGLQSMGSQSETTLSHTHKLTHTHTHTHTLTRPLAWGLARLCCDLASPSSVCNRPLF